MDQQTHIPTIDDLFGLPGFIDVQISPDGAHVAYVLSRPNWEENEYLRQIWLVPTGDGETHQLTFAKTSSTSPRWSPDGKWLAFLSKREGDEHTQIYRMSPFGGEAERLTELESDVAAIYWAPDGQSIAYTAVLPESEADKKRQETYGDYHVEDEDYQRTQLWLLELEGKKSRLLTGGDALHVAGADWHPQGGRLLVESWPTPGERDWDRARIYLVNVETLQVSPLTAEGCSTPRWSPDGSQIAFSRCGEPTYYANNEICLMPAGGGEIQTLSEGFDETVELEHWGPDGLYFWAIQRTSCHLFRLDPQSGTVTQVTPQKPAGWVSFLYSFSQDGHRAAMIGADVEHFFEITVVETHTGTVRRLTDYNQPIREWRLGRQELFQWNSTDGTPIEGILVKPPDFDPETRYPLLVVIHGGPSWVSMLGLMVWGERYYYPIQQWVNKGALVLMPNYRGSAGYGEDFRALNVRNLGLGDYEDVISGVDALIKQGWVDPERVGAMGWSQGGYISAFITTYSDRFVAVSVGAGISNWTTYYVNTDIHPFTRQYLEATPWEDMEIYRRTSPMTYINRAQTPTLIQHGENDQRVPPPNAYELYQGLQDVGVEVKLVVYKGMPHGITKPRLQRQVLQENLDWFNRWIWDEQPEDEAKPPCYVVPATGQQRPEESPLPAIERYSSIPVQDVHHWARRDRAGFRILSAESGLLPAEEPVPAGSRPLRVEEVSALAARLAEQLAEGKWPKVVLYTAEAKKNPEALIYLGCLQVAAGVVGKVEIEHQQVSENGWE